MFPAACIPALITLYTMQAYESTEIKHAFVVRMQAPGIVHHGHCILRVCIHYGRKGSASELEPKALHSTVIEKSLELPVIIIILLLLLSLLLYCRLQLLPNTLHSRLQLLQKPCTLQSLRKASNSQLLLLLFYYYY